MDSLPRGTTKTFGWLFCFLLWRIPFQPRRGYPWFSRSWPPRNPSFLGGGCPGPTGFPGGGPLGPSGSPGRSPGPSAPQEVVLQVPQSPGISRPTQTVVHVAKWFYNRPEYCRHEQVCYAVVDCLTGSQCATAATDTAKPGCANNTH